MFDIQVLRVIPNIAAEKMKYYRLAREAAERGENFFGLLQSSARCELIERERQYCDKVQIRGCKNFTECRKLNGLIISIEDALLKLPIPNRACSNTSLYNSQIGFCIGSYDPYLENE